MLYREITAVCSEIHTKHINTLCGQNVGFYKVNAECSHSHHHTLPLSIISTEHCNLHEFSDCKKGEYYVITGFVVLLLTN